MSDTFPSVGVPKTLLQLLYLRDLWGLRVATEVPAVADGPTGAQPPQPAAALIPVWEGLWADSLEALAAGHRLPNWLAVQGEQGIDVRAMYDWTHRHVERITTNEIEAVTRRSATPEAQAQDLVADLRTVYVLPLEGQYARRLSPTALIVSESTRSDPGAYRLALTE
jgi:hypothetical protein